MKMPRRSFLQRSVAGAATVAVWRGLLIFAAVAQVPGDSVQPQLASGPWQVTTHRLSEVPISRLIFGNFVELGFGRQGAGMWAEMIYNRSFQKVTPYKSPTWEWLGIESRLYNDQAPFWHSGYEEHDWELIAPEQSAKGRGFGADTFKGDGSLWLDNRGTHRVGLRQKGIYVKAGQKYDFSLFGGYAGPKISAGLEGFELSGKTATEKRIVNFNLRNEAKPEEVLFSQDLQVGCLQQEHALEIELASFTGRVVLEISFTWQGRLLLSWCSMMPRDNVRGWNAEVVQCLKRVAPPVIRFPGGCFASFYDWRKGIGPRPERQAQESYYWGGLEENDIGIDEFLDLCREIGAEPQYCVNLMTSTPFKAAELVEYCNGPDDSAMGRFRRENEVMRRQRVTYWEMDNEAGRKWSAIQYAQKVSEFAKAMRAVDPKIKIMMEYYSYGLEWLPQMLQITGPQIDLVIHRDGSPAFVQEALGVLREYNRRNGASIKQVDTEWLPNTSSPGPFSHPDVPERFSWTGRITNDHKKNLAYRQGTWFYALNAANRLMDYLSYGGEFHLANFNNCVNTWGQNIIESSKEKAWLSPCGKVFEFFTRDFQAQYPLQVVPPLEASGMLKVQACLSADGRTIVISMVNQATTPQSITLTLPAGFAVDKGEILFAPDRLSRITAQTDPVEKDNLDPDAAGMWRVKPLSVVKLRASRHQP